MRRTLVALDIGGANLRAIQFVRGKSGPKVQKVAVAPLPRGVIEAGEVRDPAALTAALKSLWSEHKLASKQVVFSIANDSVMVRELDLDWLVPEEFAAALKFQVANHVPMPIADTTLDYHVLAEYDAPTADGRDTRRMVRILLVVATSDMVASFVAPLRAAGLMPVKLDLAPFALIRAAGSAATDPDPADPHAAEAVVDIGADVTTVIVHRDGQPRYVRILTGHGGNTVTDALAARGPWSAEDAERMKIEADPGEGAPPDADPLGLGGLTEETILTITEIRDSLDYYMSTNPDVSGLSRVVLTGGGSMLHGLQARLGFELRLPVEPGVLRPDVAARLSRRPGADDAIGRQLAVATGLALGAA